MTHSFKTETDFWESVFKQAISAIMDQQFNLKIIPEFNGTGPIVEWIEKLELVCDLSGIECLDRVTRLRLTRGVFAVYQQPTEGVVLVV